MSTQKESFLKWLLLNIITAVHVLADPCVSLDRIQDNKVEQCSKQALCNRHYRINYIYSPPYHSEFNITTQILQKCCGACVKATGFPTMRHVHEIDGLFDRDSNTSADLVYPYLAKSTTIKEHGYFFIPMIRLPGLVYVTLFKETAFGRSINGVLNLWPLIIILLLMSLISGFIIWVVETRENVEEFPRSLHLGWLSGIWWTTLTMFSQGLDSHPKSILARVLSLLWLMIGVIMMAILTSVITAILVEPVPVPTMLDAKVATMNYLPYNDYVIMKHGGTVVKFPQGVTLYEEEMVNMFVSYASGSVDGVIMDKYTMNFGMNQLNSLWEVFNIPGISKKTFIEKTTKTVRKYLADREGEDMFYGILVKDQLVYEYFKDAIKANWHQHEALFLNIFNNKSDIIKKNQNFVEKYMRGFAFSIDDQFVVHGLRILAYVLCALFIVGVLFEVFRRTNECWGCVWCRERCSKGLENEKTKTESVSL